MHLSAEADACDLFFVTLAISSLIPSMDCSNQSWFSAQTSPDAGKTRDILWKRILPSSSISSSFTAEVSTPIYSIFFPPFIPFHSVPAHNLAHTAFYTILSAIPSVLPPGIFRRISDGGRLIIANLFHRHADILEHLEQGLSVVAERNSAMVRISSFDQYVAVEPSHLGNCKYSDASKGSGCDRKNFSVGDVGPQTAVRRTLQPEEGNISRNDISFQCSLRHLLWKCPCHDLLILHLAECQFG